MASNLKKIRDFERMIKKFGSSPELLAKLESAKMGKHIVTVKERTRKNSTKYHMVRFLERKKVTRKVRSLESKLKKADGKEAVELNKQRDNLLNDLAYIMYYPMEHKYIALFPGKDDRESDSENEDGAKMSDEKSKAISQKARELALQRWEQDKQRLADGIEGGGDKVAYAMEVEYKGGVAAAESAPGKTSVKDTTKDTQGSAPKDGRFEKANKLTGAAKTVTTKAGSKHTTFGTDSGAAAGNSIGADNTTATQNKRSAAGSGSDSDSSSSDSDSSDSGSGSSSDSDSEDSRDDKPKPTAKVAAKATVKPASAKADSSKSPASWAVPIAPEEESSDNDGDDFFVEEAGDEALVNSSAAPKVYNDGNNFRFKEERKSVHEIRFAATKRKYERHKRVFNNQNKRGASDRGSKKQRN